MDLWINYIAYTRNYRKGLLMAICDRCGHYAYMRVDGSMRCLSCNHDTRISFVKEVNAFYEKHHLTNHHFIEYFKSCIADPKTMKIFTVNMFLFSIFYSYILFSTSTYLTSDFKSHCGYIIVLLMAIGFFSPYILMVSNYLKRFI